MFVIVEPGGSWFGPYDTAERARERREHLRTRGDSLGVTLARGARILPARYTPDGIEWDWTGPVSVADYAAATAQSPFTRRALSAQLPTSAINGGMAL